MESALIEKLSEYGVLGIVLGLSGLVLRYLFIFNMNQLKAAIAENKASLEKSRDEERTIACEYREYMRATSEQAFNIINKNSESMNENTKAFIRFTDLMEVYMEQRRRERDELNFEREELKNLYRRNNAEHKS